jgi:membrane protein DedA with SNARE-associated domain
MFGIGEWLQDVFGPYGVLGILLFVFLIFFIDALFFPTLPELFFIIGFMAMPEQTLTYGVQLLAVAVVAEVAGISLLYGIVERVRVPERIKKIADKYVKFLIVKDERMLLVNRAAPVIPFAGAFISLIDDWRLSRSLFYVVIGCLIKYGLILLMSSFFFSFFSDGDAQTYTIVFIVIVIAVSIAAAFMKKKKEGLADADN